jgi:hypothetical protein
MSQTWPAKYQYRVCPFCRSKKIKPVGLWRFGSSQYVVNPQQIQRTGHLCSNCNRYHAEYDYKYIIDRAEMKRDIKILQKHLYAEGKS